MFKKVAKAKGGPRLLKSPSGYPWARPRAGVSASWALDLEMSCLYSHIISFLPPRLVTKICRPTETYILSYL